MARSERPTAVCLFCGLRFTEAELRNHIDQIHGDQMHTPPVPRPPPVKVTCPVCHLTGTLMGLTGHIRDRHPQIDIPQFEPAEIDGRDRWEIRAGNRLPTALVATQYGNPSGKPWWWYVKPAEDRDRRLRQSNQSGTSDTVPEAQDVALARWLSLMPSPAKGGR